MRFFKKILFLIIIVIFIVTLYSTRNHIRIYLFKSSPVKYSSITLDKTIDEGDFEVSIFNCKRTYSNRMVNYANKIFSDKLMVIRIPIENFKFKGLVLKPEGDDVIPSNPMIYFNTLFFMDNFHPTTGSINDQKKVSNKTPKKTRLGITAEGKISVFQSGKNSIYDDVLQAPFTFNISSKVRNNFKTINYRQFVTIYNGDLIYIAGYNNALICWNDVSELMRYHNLKSIIALDGGASLNYYFKGEQNIYQFSSVPFRDIWFNKNSPYYLTGELNK